MGLIPSTITKVNRRRPPQWLYPRTLEKRYASRLSRIFHNTLRESIQRRVLSRLPWLLQMVDANRPGSPRADSIINDAWPDEVRLMRQQLTFDLATIDPIVERSAASLAVDLYRQNRNQWKRIQKAMIGVEAVGENEAWASDMLDGWIESNVSLINKLSSETSSNIEGIVSRGLQTGLRVEEIQKDIIGILGESDKMRKRARFIARDQVAKLNGMITQARQTELGVSRYIWRTSQDERVRESHRVLEGMMCRWDNPTVYSDDDGKTWKKRSSIGAVELHPGQDYQDRCYAEPVLQDVIEEAGP